MPSVLATLEERPVKLDVRRGETNATRLREPDFISSGDETLVFPLGISRSPANKPHDGFSSDLLEQFSRKTSSGLY